MAFHNNIPVFVIFWTLLRMSKAAELTALVKSPITISCRSNLAPTWHWSDSKGKNDRILALAGVNPHPTLKNPRYSFTEKESVYVIRITNLLSNDAGTFSCFGDETDKTVLNILR